MARKWRSRGPWLRRTRLRDCCMLPLVRPNSRVTYVLTFLMDVNLTTFYPSVTTRNKKAS